MDLPETAVYIPVPAAEPLVGSLRSRWDPVAGLGVPAHITLVHPFLPTDRLTVDVLDEVAGVLGGTSRFDLRLTGFGRFARTSYLVPEPTAPIERLETGLRRAWPDLLRLHPDFVPHLTVADDVPEHVIETVERALAGRLPIRATAAQVHVAARTDRRWEVIRAITLG